MPEQDGAALCILADPLLGIVNILVFDIRLIH